MTSVIWKFPLEIDDVCDVKMPKGAHILSVDVQDGPVVVWAMVDPEAELVTRRILIVGTGHPRDDIHPARFIGSVQQPWIESITFVWHVFDGGEEDPE